MLPYSSEVNREAIYGWDWHEGTSNYRLAAGVREACRHLPSQWGPNSWAKLGDIFWYTHIRSWPLRNSSMVSPVTKPLHSDSVRLEIGGNLRDHPKIEEPPFPSTPTSSPPASLTGQPPEHFLNLCIFTKATAAPWFWLPPCTSIWLPDFYFISLLETTYSPCKIPILPTHLKASA